MEAAEPWATQPVAGLQVAFLGLLLVNAVLFPPFRAPDEGFHVDLGLAYAETDAVVLRERALDSSVRAAAAAYGLDGPPADEVPLPADTRRPNRSFAELGWPDPGSDRNQMTQHPPLYYRLLGAVAALAGGADGLEAGALVTLFRLVGVLLVAPLPWLCWRAAHELGTATGTPVDRTAAAAVPLAIPMLAHIGASANNDTLLIALGAVLTVLLVRVAVRRPVAPWLVGGVAAVALLVKGFALVTPAWVAAAYLPWRQHWRPAAVALGVTLVGGGWWWLGNVLREGSVQPTHASLPVAAETFAPDAGWWAGFAVARVTRRFWVEPDTVQQTMRWEWLPMLLLVGLAVAGATVLARRRCWVPLAVLVLPLAGSAVIMLVGAWTYYTTTGAPFGLHGRYLYPALGGVAVLAGTGLARWRRLRWPAAAAAAATVLWALAAALRFYWGGDVAAVLTWSPLPAWGVAVAAAAVPGGLAWSAWVTWQR